MKYAQGYKFKITEPMYGREVVDFTLFALAAVVLFALILCV